MADAPPPKRRAVQLLDEDHVPFLDRTLPRRGNTNILSRIMDRERGNRRSGRRHIGYTADDIFNNCPLHPSDETFPGYAPEYPRMYEPTVGGRSNRWISHVKKHAKKHKMTFRRALKSARKTYRYRC